MTKLILTLQIFIIFYAYSNPWGISKAHYKNLCYFFCKAENINGGRRETRMDTAEETESGGDLKKI